MQKEDHFENHPVYNYLSYDTIVGLIQLLIDEGKVAATERNGIYIEFKDLRDKVIDYYQKLNEEQKQDYIAYFRYRHHLDKPYIHNNSASQQ